MYFRKGSAPISPADNSHKTREEIERQKLEEEEIKNKLAKVTLAPSRDDVNLNNLKEYYILKKNLRRGFVF